MGKAGQKPTNRGAKYVFEDDEWWYYYPKDGTSIHTGGHLRERASTLKKRIASRMYVDGKYIPTSHPLHKPGRYKGFSDAAFSSLKNYSKSKQGQVYVMRNPSFPGWCKIGKAVDAEDRLKNFQTSSPYRDYELVAVFDSEDRRKDESKAHDLLRKHYAFRGEWFFCDASLAINKLNVLFEKDNNEDS